MGQQYCKDCYPFQVGLSQLPPTPCYQRGTDLTALGLYGEDDDPASDGKTEGWVHSSCAHWAERAYHSFPITERGYQSEQGYYMIMFC